MTDVLAVDVSHGDEAVRVARALAAVLGTEVRTLDDLAPDAVLDALSLPSALTCVLPTNNSLDGLAWRVLRQATKPVVLVPHGAHLRHGRIARALLPLDGSPESAVAVARTAQLLDRAGVDLVILHVFAPATVPSFWDQPAHTPRTWIDEFLARSGAPKRARLELRSGEPGEHVVLLAESEDVDLIALGWSRTDLPGRAATVRRTILDAPVPVLLVPTGTAA